MERILAWFDGQIIDRVPVRFSAHNAEYDHAATTSRRWGSLRERWFDAEYQVESYLQSLAGQSFLAESIPVFWPNLGPEVYSAFYGSELTYQEVTSYSVPLVQSWDEMDKIRFDTTNAYYRKIDEMTAMALERCAGQCLVGYTDLHGGMDCAAAWRDPQQLCLDLLEAPERVVELLQLAEANFQRVYDHYYDMLTAAGQPSVTWMRVPAPGKLHIPSCDFAAMISPALFEEFVLPGLHREIRAMSHNIFHVDGRGVARHLDPILAIPGVQAIQWVQGVGTDRPIMQWAPLIKRMRAAGKSIVIDLEPSELESFIAEFPPEGFFLCIDAPAAMQPEILKRIARW
ncbi:MAG: hypothetical protein HZA31_02620 [Opitutae bacterium]|nr:hypothetical protein [Opitutae bacterium]